MSHGPLFSDIQKSQGYSASVKAGIAAEVTHQRQQFKNLWNEGFNHCQAPINMKDNSKVMKIQILQKLDDFKCLGKDLLQQPI